jgi:AcrR family transcriptional regulator
VAFVTSVGQTRALRGRRPVRPSGDEREQAILATAERLLETRPFAGISVDDLAKGAGLSRPTFYFYFKSKEAVVLSLLEPVIARADAEFDGAVQRLPADPRRVWRNGIKAFFTAFGSHRPLARAATEALASSSELRSVWSGFMQKWIDQTAAMITAERERGAAPDTIPAADDHRAAAQCRVVALFDGRVEGIEVRVQDVGCLDTRAPHEHMFACGSDS